MTEAVIFFASRYDFADEKGTQRKGAKVKYFLPEKAEGENKEGIEYMESPMPFELFETLKHYNLPGMFEIDFRMKPGRDNKPEMSLVKAQFKRKIELFKDGK
ncbi:hypothetical protein [Noviherbaspirillum sp.]|uniref:hypothetical protein n=1 Tax=Noviherbaspirillum sp. TaxID=1926288 RepID=UPI002B472676|nr:hypothetical protein [Noviherbaspirillum sp.]HJV82446.1 hypothetical protein [Noviherbaspirillum sp.]